LLYCLSQRRQSSNFNKVKVVATYSIFFSVRIHVDLYLPEGRSSVQALSTITDFSNLHLYTEDYGLLLIVKFRNEHTASCVFTYHDTQMCLTTMKLMWTFGKCLLDMNSVSLFSASFAWTIYHSGKYSTTSAQVACRKGCGPLCRVIIKTVLSQWQLQLDEICETPKYQHLWNNCPMGHSRWSLATLLAIQNRVGSYTELLGTTFVLHFFMVAILQIALNSNDQSLCACVCVRACVSACVRVCVCLRACVRACVYV